MEKLWKYLPLDLISLTSSSTKLTEGEIAAIMQKCREDKNKAYEVVVWLTNCTQTALIYKLRELAKS